MMIFKKFWKKWTLISFFFVVAFFIYVTLNQKSCEEYYEQEKNIYFEGIITKKIINKNEHNYPILIIEGNGETIRYNLTSDLSGLYDFAEIGDEIKKEKGFNEITVKRNSNEIVYILDYGCK